MKLTLLITLFALTALQANAQGVKYNEDSVDLEALYQEIDEAISNSPQYVKELEKKISVCRDSFLIEKDPEKRIQKAESLFQIYRSYKNDSAQHYIELCINLSDSLHRPDLAGRYRSLMAYQCSSTSIKAESVVQFQKIDKRALDNQGLVEYYHALMHFYGELGRYTQRDGMKRYYFDQQNLYRDSVMMVANEGSEEWLHLKMDILTATRHFQDALAISNKWLKTVKPGTHESSYAAFYRSVVFDHLGNHDLACYWLGRSALDDIRCAVMDQASLLFLAEYLANDGDVDRSIRYLEFSKKCNATFLPYLRPYQTDYAFNIFKKSREVDRQRTNMILYVSVAVIILLLLALIFVIVRNRKRK